MIIRLFIIAILASAIFGGAYYAVHTLYLEPQQRLAADKKLPAPTPPPDPSIEEFARCQEIRRTSTSAAAKAAFERFLKEFPETKKKDAALDVIGEINSEEFFAAKMDDSNTYVVKPGDSLSRVSLRTKLSVEMLVQLNKLRSDVLHPGQKLLAPDCDFRILLRQKTRRVVVTNGEKFFRHYPALSWPGGNKPNPIFLPKQTGRVIDKRALGERGASAKPTDMGFFAASHVLILSIPGHGIYSHNAESGTGPRPDGASIGLAPAHASEIAILIPKGAPVTMD